MKDMPEFYDHVEEEIDAEMKRLNSDDKQQIQELIEEMEDALHYCGRDGYVRAYIPTPNEYIMYDGDDIRILKELLTLLE